MPDAEDFPFDEEFPDAAEFPADAELPDAAACEVVAAGAVTVAALPEAAAVAGVLLDVAGAADDVTDAVAVPPHAPQRPPAMLRV